ncbi:MAG: amino acid adenylation domain-containing protein, partial [Limisphaerales bacterium]
MDIPRTTQVSHAQSYIFPAPTLHETFELQAAQRPDSLAIVYESERLTYGELNRKANQLAHLLIHSGLRPGALAGIFMERSPRTVVAVLAILKAGGAYVPIDPVYPDERALWMLTDSASVAVVTESELAPRLKGYKGKVVALDQGYDCTAGGREENPRVAQVRQTPAYAIYTSGSTGQPKGVSVTHHNVLRLFESTQHWFHFNQNDVWSLFHSFAFDFSVWELWGGLLYGGTVVVVPYLTARDPSGFYDLLEREEVTVLSQTPSAFRQLMWAEEKANAKYAGLRYVVFGGEALELQSLRPWFNRHPANAPQLVNMYGITETTVHVTYRVITPKDLDENRGSVIGEPIPDLTIHLLDEQGKEVRPGTAGEIYVGGEGVALGYLNRPELTMQRFVKDPFRNQAGARLYRSGDLAKRLPNGDLEYLGRIDHQVKIHGFRIELGEIESVINLHPAVRESAVICDESTGDKRLLAYVVAREKAPSFNELRDFAAKRLPAYMLPRRVILLEEIPLTVNGKVNRKALPLPDTQRPLLETSFSAPSSAEEKILAKIWEQVLEVNQVGINDNFFELGGDSIRSIQVLARAEAHGLKISLQTIFSHPTIAGLLDNLNSESEDELHGLKPFCLISGSDLAKLPADAEDAYPIRKLQHGMI